MIQGPSTGNFPTHLRRYTPHSKKSQRLLTAGYIPMYPHLGSKPQGERSLLVRFSERREDSNKRGPKRGLTVFRKGGGTWTMVRIRNCSLKIFNFTKSQRNSRWQGENPWKHKRIWGLGSFGSDGELPAWFHKTLISIEFLLFHEKVRF